MNTLQPQTNFRLWLTTEVHPEFTPVLLQSSLKITYEVRSVRKACIECLKRINFNA